MVHAYVCAFLEMLRGFTDIFLLVMGDVRAPLDKVVLKGRHMEKVANVYVTFGSEIVAFAVFGNPNCSPLHHYLPVLGGMSPIWTKSVHPSDWTKHLYIDIFICMSHGHKISPDG